MTLHESITCMIYCPTRSLSRHAPSPFDPFPSYYCNILIQANYKLDKIWIWTYTRTYYKEIVAMQLQFLSFGEKVSVWVSSRLDSTRLQFSWVFHPFSHARKVLCGSVNFLFSAWGFFVIFGGFFRVKLKVKTAKNCRSCLANNS